MENKKQVTAVEWLYEKLWKEFNFSFSSNILEQAKEMEKQQHQETFKQSRQAKIFEKDMPPVWGYWEQYYSETFKK